MRTGSSHRVRVLAAEDSPTQAAFLRRTLEQAGFDVTMSVNGLEALARAAQEPFDICVSDVVMPELDGHGLCRALKSELPRVPVILLTGADDPLGAERALDAGADGFLSKPFLPAELVARVRSVVFAAPHLRSGSGVAASKSRDSGPGTAHVTPPIDPTDPLDRVMVAALQELVLDSTDDFVEPLAAFESAAVASHRRLELAVSDGCAATIAQITHELAGTSGSFGAHVVSSTCRQLEQYAIEGHLEDAPPLVWAIRAQLEVAFDALHEAFPSQVRRAG